MNIVIGIDPGMTGSATILDVNGGVIDVLDFSKMTDTDVFHALKEWIADNQAFAYLERLHSIQPAGKTANFNLGCAYGTLRGFLIALQIAFDEVLPTKWQTYLGCRTKGDKHITQTKAQALFPSRKWTLKTADSVLIAEYGRRMRKYEIC